MKKTLFVSALLCLIGYQDALAQQNISPKDSILQIIKSYTIRDTVRVNALIDIQPFFLLDEHEQGRAFIEEAISISEELNYSTGYGFSLNALGAYYLRRGHIDSALASITEAISEFERIGENHNIYAAFNNLALVYKSSGDFDKAYETYVSMLNRLEGRPKTSSFAIIYFNIAALYEAQEDWENFEYWMTKMVELSDSLNFIPGVKEGSLGLAKTAIIKKQYDQALNRTSFVLNDATTKGEMAQIEARAFDLQGDVYALKGEYALSIENYQRSIEVYTKINSTRYASVIYKKLSDVYISLENYEEAFSNSEMYHQLKDSLMSAEKVEIIEELQTKYETEKLKREIDSAEIENLKLLQSNQRSRSLIIGAFGFVFFLTLFGGVLFRQRRLQQDAQLQMLELRESQKRLLVEQEKRAAELKAVRAQLNPHFIFNLMNSVQEFMLKGKAEDANKALLLVSKLMRLTLKHSEQELIPLSSELELITTYLEAEKLRFGNKISYQINVDEEIETEFISIPPMLIQPYVENAIQHGLMHKEDPGEVQIQIKELENEQLQIVVNDDGIGRKAAGLINTTNPEKHNRFSTKANEQRILNLSEQSNQKGSVSICDSKKDGTGTKVIIELPLEILLTTA